MQVQRMIDMYLALKNSSIQIAHSLWPAGLFKPSRSTVRLIFILSLAAGVFIPFNGFSQKDDDKKSEQEKFMNFEEPDFLIDKDTTEVIKKKKKKRKKKTFNGLKTKRAFTRKGKGSRMTLELFYYLKKHRDPDPYVTPLYLFEVQKLRIVKITKYDKEKYPPKQFRVLHGPYTKTQDTVTLATGYFYIGTKHHRWEKFSRGEILKEKNEYYKGWPADSKISYYDSQKKKLKEVIPIMFGERSGMYLSFYENGSLKEKGRFERDIKVGKWTEYYKFRKRKKKVTQHASNGYDEDYTPTVINAWDEEGKITFGEDPKKKGKKGKRGKLGAG